MNQHDQRVYFRLYRSTFGRDLDLASQAIGYRLAVWLRVWCMRPGFWNRGQVAFIGVCGVLIGLAVGKFIFAPNTW